MKCFGKSRTTNNSRAQIWGWVLEEKVYSHLSAQQVPYSATVPGHLIRPGNGDEMLVKNSPSSLAVRSQILQKILRHAVYRDLMNTTGFC